MTVTTITLNIGNTQALDVFNDVSYMAFGDGLTSPDSTQTTLVNELLRVPIFEINKDSVNYEYIYKGRIPITELNSDTINEIALFNALSGGDMASRVVLSTGVTKTSNDELIFILKIKVNTINT